MKNLEKFIKENKSKFEIEPPKGHFDRFENKLQGQKTFRIKRIMQASYKYAAIALVVILAMFVYHYVSTNTKNDNITAKTETYQTEYDETFAYYSNIINKKKAELKNIKCTNKDFNSSEILDDMNELENSFAELKNEYAKSGKNEQVYNAIIENYNMRIEFLDMVTKKVKKYC